ncbi:MAG: 30S ribosomal protein S18 [Patescibacteria group bacterium]|jgi:small subunit ribosomal protein S18
MKPTNKSHSRQPQPRTGKRNRFYVKALESLNYDEIDYKNVEMLRLVMSNYFRILAGNRTGAHARMQRKLATAIKRSRTMALLPFTRL